jgi:uncharacterized protein
MVRLLLHLLRYPRITLGVGVLLALLSAHVAYNRLQFTTDRTQLLDPKHPVQLDWNRYRTTFGQNTDYVVLVRSANPEHARDATDALGEALRSNARFGHVFYRVDLPKAELHGLYFLPRKNLEQLNRWLNSAQPWLQVLSREAGAVGLLHAVSAAPTAAELARQMRPVLPLVVRTLEGLEQSLESGGRSAFVSPLGPYPADVPMLQGRTVEPGQTRFYNQLADGNTFMLIARASDGSGSFQADLDTLHELRRVVSAVRRSAPDVTLMISGEPAINTEEMEDARIDAYDSAMTALIGVAALLFVAFGQVTRPLCAVFSLLLGLAWTTGFAAISVGQLNLLTVHFATILMGLGITFGIQVLSEFQTARGRQKSALVAITAALYEARHQSIGAIATSVAFFSLYFTSFRAAAQLGWITGVGVLLCYLASVTILPCLLIMVEHGRPCGGYPRYGRWIAPLERWLRAKHQVVSAVCVLLTLGSLAFVGRVPFDYNLLRLQAADAEAIRVEGYLQRIGYSTLYAISMAPDVEEARRRVKLLEQLPTVARVESVLSLEPNDAAEKQSTVESLVALARSLKIPGQPGPMGANELLALYDVYQPMRGRLLDTARALSGQPDGKRLRELVDRFDKLLDPGRPGPLAAGLQSYQQAALDDLRKQLQFLKRQRTTAPDILSMVPQELRLRSISEDGTVCLRIFPKENCWEREPLQRLVADLVAVDPHITGTPVLIYHYLEQLKEAYSVAARNALLVITVLLLIYYRSVHSAALALLPKLAGVCWMMGTMALLGTSFNPANFLALPLTLGIGLIFGIESLRSCQHPDRPLMSTQSAGFAMALSGVTTMLGFSILMQAHHRGVESFGLVMTLGVGMNLLTALVMLPAMLLSWEDTRRRR